jgi:hypothetical protein
MQTLVAKYVYSVNNDELIVGEILIFVVIADIAPVKCEKLV